MAVQHLSLDPNDDAKVALIKKASSSSSKTIRFGFSVGAPDHNVPPYIHSRSLNVPIHSVLTIRQIDTSLTRKVQNYKHTHYHTVTQ